MCKHLVIAALVALGMTLLVNPTTGVAYADGMNWDAVAQCESGGGLQFKPSTWAANGGIGDPAMASREQQIAVANRVLATQGAGAWPKCGGNGQLFPIQIVNIFLHPVRGTLQTILSLVPH
jgi:hypothetical protein